MTQAWSKIIRYMIAYPEIQTIVLHTQSAVCSSQWEKPYKREQAVFPLEYVKQNKFWPSVARVNNTHGDRNLICTCEPVESYMEEEA